MNAGISGSDIRDIMLEAIEQRFGAYKVSHPIEIPSDNGSPCIAKEARIFARQFGLKPCFTPVKSPQSNGISLAIVLGPMADNNSPFMKTLKRDSM